MLTEISFPKNLNNIGDNCFAGTGLKDVTIPNNVTLGENAFPSGCITN